MMAGIFGGVAKNNRILFRTRVSCAGVLVIAFGSSSSMVRLVLYSITN